MNTIKELSTENIRSRMIKNAARIWGVEGDDIESTFDPMVTMLIEACAFELYKVNNEISNSQSRILERLAQVLSPDTFTGAQPAYAIAHARSVEPEGKLNREIQLYAQQKITTTEQKEVVKDIYFSPVSKINIFDTAVKYMAVGRSVYEFKTPSSKLLLTEDRSGAALPASHVWLGIDVNNKLSSLNNFVFYFDWKNDPEKENHLNLLPLTKWFYQNEDVVSINGINQSEVSGVTPKSITEQYDISLRHEKFVNNLYKRNFYTLQSNLPLNTSIVSGNFPEELQQAFSQQTLDKLEGKCIWLKLVFPGAMPPNALNDVYISMNSFPVVNRKVNSITYQLRNNLNIVPLKTDEIFYDIISIQNAEGNYFKANPLESGFKNQAGFYTLRYGGVERFDSRAASEFLQSTIDLLRDESAAFSSLGNEFINTYISQINQAIAMIENRLDTKGEKQKPSHFVIINPIKQNENIFLKFWSTSGLDGNAVKAGTKLTLASGGMVSSASLVLLTSSAGGKKALNEDEKIAALKRSILTHDRIVTQQDIETFCYHELTGMISSVQIKRGWQQSNMPKQGMIRIVEVHITPHPSQRLTEGEWTGLAKELQLKIENASNGLIPIRVLVNMQKERAMA
jgi:hypothetical protein